MKRVIFIFFGMIVFAGILQAQTKNIETIYTDLAAEKCKTIESYENEGGLYRGECPGVSGYKLELVEGDIRQSINVISPDLKKSKLELWSNVSSAFSSVGSKAEWRVTKSGASVSPFAMIIRFNTNEDPENTEQITSRLVVIKIENGSACITDIVEPVKDANLRARELADASARKPCKFETGRETEETNAVIGADESSSKTTQDSYINLGQPDLIVADVADYEKTDVPVWKTFASEAELEKAREQQESYTIAYIWKKGQSISQVNFTYFSESGDWVEYWFNTYREDGSLAKVDHELRTFNGDVIVNKVRMYSDRGKLLEESKTFRDLNTQKPIPPKEYMDSEVGQVYLRVSDLPFFSLLSSGSNYRNDESAFVPSGWKQEALATGDLNGDSVPDSVLQIIRENSEDDVSDRSLIILFKNAGGNFTKAAEARDLLICSSCGGVKGGPPGMEIKNRVLSVSQMSGSRQFTQYLHRFRYEPQSGKFLLIGEDISEFDGLGLEISTSTNYLTGKQVIKKTRYDEQTDKDVVVSVQDTKVIKSKKYIEEVVL